MLVRRPARHRLASGSSRGAASAQLVQREKPLYAQEMAGYLSRPARPVILPPPLPKLPSTHFIRSLEAGEGKHVFSGSALAGAFSSLRDASTWNRDPVLMDLLGVMDACLHNCHNVPRAKSIFDRVRMTNPTALNTPVYNRVLETYLALADNPKPENALGHPQPKEYWLEEIKVLYHTMTTEIARPNHNTLAVLFLSHLRHPEEFSLETKPGEPGHASSTHTPESLLQRALELKIDPTDIIVSRSVRLEEGPSLIKLVSRAAAAIGRLDIVTNMTRIDALGRSPSSESLQTNSDLFPDPLAHVPEARPVRKRVRKVVDGPDGKKIETEEEVDGKIPFNLDDLRSTLAMTTLSRRVLPEDVAARQKLLEQSMYDVAKRRLAHEQESIDALGLSTDMRLKNGRQLQKFMWSWHKELQPKLAKEIQAIQDEEDAKSRGSPTYIAPYLNLIKPERLSLLVIMEIMRLAGSGGIQHGMKAARALISIGQAVESEYKAQLCKRSNIRLVTPMSSLPGSHGGGDASGSRMGSPSYFTRLGYKSLQERRVTAARLMDDSETWSAPWSQPLRGKIGGVLVDCLLSVAKVTVVDPETGATEQQDAFMHGYEHLRGQRLGVIRLHPEISQYLANDQVTLSLTPRHLPMLVKPKPWTSPDSGGYMYSRSPVMRFKDCAEQEEYFRRASDNNRIELIYAGLDTLGATPWKIHEKVFKVVLEQWNTGERMGKMPPAVFDLPQPSIQDILQEELTAAGADTTIQPLRPLNPQMEAVVKKKYNARLRQWNNGKGNNHSNRCSVNYKIEIARAFLGEVFYQPHNVDFRGRAYPIPPHLNHMGDDLSRGLMCFAEGKPLGVRGLRWLKIHLANLAGYDKASFEDRVKWTEERLPLIFDSAENPLGGQRWWTNADDPWQCLSVCFDLHEAFTNPKLEKPEDHISYQPVHQDGTCNGLQHYAALGGDAEGAAQVNLSPGERPSDVYSYVGSMVEKKLEQDKLDGNPWAEILSGKISRKVVKQTVMTTVYGVTFIGARAQIEKQLKDRGDISAEHCWESAAYLTRVTLDSIGNLFSAATHIQNWLTICARLISKSIHTDRLTLAFAEWKKGPGKGADYVPPDSLRKEQMTSVAWETPLGLPVVQPYRKSNKKQILTSLQSIFISDPSSPREVNSMKQASAFPPNFIHSLDATHMMLTALECRQQNMSFAAVHDSYWTHASDIDKLSELIRETFVELHSSDILPALRDSFMNRFGSFKIPLEHLRSAGFKKQLTSYGVKLNVTPEEAESLQNVLGDIISVTTTGPSHIEELGSASQRMRKIMKNAARNAKGEIIAEDEETSTALQTLRGDVSEEEEDEVDDEDEDDLDEDDSIDVEDHEEAKPKKTVKRRSARSDIDSEQRAALYGRFVSLRNLIPPLPAKGTFAVEEIKNSPYFFS
ncbi:DNA/RNA polymerase [Flagelloscypha sp. PMI_526]|nr:DNA/RNA polymerase [Flagelloscypha sp. PMI_526]